MGKKAGQIIGGLEVIAGAVLIFTGVGTAAGLALIASGLGTLAASFVPSPSAPDPVAQAEGNRHTFKAAVVSHKIIYGAARISGPLYELGTTSQTFKVKGGIGGAITAVTATSGAGVNKYLHVILPLAGHQLESIGNVIINGQLVDGTGADPKWKTAVRVKRHLGGSLQTVDLQLAAELVDANGTKIWDSTHVGNGIAYVYIRLAHDKLLFPQGLKDIQCDVLGKRVYDPRTLTTAYSNNWALCMRDYLTSSLGVGMAAADIDDSYIIGAANVSDEIVNVAGGTQARYTLNGMVDTKNRPTDNLKAMLTAGAGHIVPLVEGKLRLIPGAYSIPTITLTDSDLRGPVKYKEHAGRKELFNTVTGKYAGAESDWKLLSYPQVGLQSAVTADGAVVRKEISLPYCTDHERCQRIAYLVLQQHRAGGFLTLQCKPTAMEVVTMDVVKVTLPELNFVNETFRVVSWKMNKDLGIDLVLKKDSAALYTWTSNLSTPFVPVPPTAPVTPPGTGGPGIPVTVNGLQLTGLGASTVFTGPDASFTWRHTTATDFNGLATPPFGAAPGSFAAWFLGYDIRILAGTTIILKDFTAANTYVFPFAINNAIATGPYRAFTIEVRIKGTGGQLTQPARLSVSNPAPKVPTGLSLTASFTTGWINFTPPTDLDYAGTIAYLSPSIGFVPSAANQVADVKATNKIALTGLLSGTQYFVRVASYDMFGKVGLNVSTELSVTTQVITSAQTDKTPPSVPVVDPLTTVVDTTTMIPTSSVVVSWAASTDNGILSGYEVQWFDNVNTVPVISFTATLQYVIVPAVVGRTYSVQVRAVDWASNRSAFSPIQTVVAAGSALPPPVPTGLTAVGGLDKITFTWANPVDPSFMQARLYVSTIPAVTAIPANMVYSGMGNTYVLQVVPLSSYYAVVTSVSSSGVESAISVEIGPSQGVIINPATAPNYIANAAIGSAMIKSLDAGLITTGTLDAAVIGAGTITAAMLKATTLSAISADLGSVTAGSLVGAIIKTAAAGARISLDSFNGLMAINAAGSPTAQIRPDGSGFLGLSGTAGASIIWNAAGTVTLPGELLSGIITGLLIRTGTTGFRVELGPVNSAGTVYLLRYHNGAGVVPFSIDDAGNASFSGIVNATAGTFSGEVNVGSFNSVFWPAAGGTGAHMGTTGTTTYLRVGNKNGASAANPTGTNGYFEVIAPSGGNATIHTNIPAYLATAQVQSLHIGANAATTLSSTKVTGAVAVVVVTIANTSTFQLIGRVAMPLTTTIAVQYSVNGVNYVNLARGTLLGGTTGVLTASLRLAAGTYYFRMNGGTGVGASILAFASTR